MRMISALEAKLHGFSLIRFYDVVRARRLDDTHAVEICRYGPMPRSYADQYAERLTMAHPDGLSEFTVERHRFGRAGAC